MRRFSVSLSLAVVVLLGLLASGVSTRAQDATPDAMSAMMAMATHPIVGAWEWDNDPDDPGTNISYALFHADGTYLEIGTDGQIDIGLWKPTGARTADVTFFFADVEPDPDVVVRGVAKMAAEVDETGNAITAPFTFEARAADGTVPFSGQFLALGTRLEVMPMVPLGTPVAATPAA
jgi:hypothetical protein